MSAVSPRRIEANAFVDPLRTVFYATGDQERVLQFLTEISVALTALPVDRLDAELGVLQAEGCSAGVEGGLRTFRFGASGHGLPGYDEIGLSCLGADEIQAWASHRFVAANAVLSMTASPPSGFRLSLPDGRWREPPAIAALPFDVPATFKQGHEMVAMSAVGKRCPALAAGARIAEDRLTDALRTRRGRSYEIVSEYDPLDASHAYWVAAASGRPEHAREVTTIFWTTLRQLADEGPSDEELSDERSENAAFLEGRRDGTGLLTFLADGHLLGGEPLDFVSARARDETLDAATVSSALSDALETALLMTPESADPPDDFSRYPLYSDSTVDGHRYSGNNSKKEELVVGPQGVTATSDGHNYVTVLWSECEAMLRWPNGDRAPMSRDGMRIHVCSGQWKDGFSAIEEIDRYAPADVVVDVRPEAFPAGGWLVEQDDDEFFAAPSWDHDGWALVDLSRMGGTGGLPPLAPEPELAALDVGDLATVTVAVRADDGSISETEELTVMVASAAHEFYAGTMAKPSRLVPALKESAGIAFAPHHVATTTKRKVAGKAWRQVIKVINR